MFSPFDSEIHFDHMRRERVREAQLEALAKQAPPRTGGLRAQLALALRTLADRLDTPRVATPARSTVR